MAFTTFKALSLPIVDATLSAKKHCGIAAGATNIEFSVRLVADFRNAASARRWRRLYLGYEQAYVQVVAEEPQSDGSVDMSPVGYGPYLCADTMVIPSHPYPGNTWIQLGIGGLTPLLGGGYTGLPQNLWWNIQVTGGLKGAVFQVVAAW